MSELATKGLPVAVSILLRRSRPLLLLRINHTLSTEDIPAYTKTSSRMWLSLFLKGQRLIGKSTGLLLPSISDSMHFIRKRKE